MLVLLPPSEGKASGGSGPVLDLAGLSLPELTAARERVIDSLVTLCEGDETKALEMLGLGPKLRGEVLRNLEVREAPTLPVSELYTGVLYDALGLGTLDRATARRAERCLLVFSGLWGALRPADRVPPYRLSMGVRLPGLGALPGLWRAAMDKALPELAGEGLVLDLRSSAYVPAWRPAGEVAARTATVRVLHERVVDGVTRRSVVSHFNKATKGRLTRQLLVAGAEPADPAELAVALRDLGWTVEVAKPAKRNAAWGLDVVVSEV
ncbi:peroxide stress protein YaaA [Yinghuangia sp. ASG 101]|uniref:peroxide stress protein YaaA n=1 Tax=Yinghuangia sp. ASG 101 TaxID=2896848 RepID=UPI001E43CDC3|nr:peroxide stress protein YaaA [Yinghuangia sp. ASG 101]UGQ13988.1 peroxide stress protein YaaA [Yinghuangia sp. ASG 101]